MRVLLERNDSGGVIVSHYVVPVKPTPVVPSPAATLVLLRDRIGGGVEVLLTQRHRASKFAAGDYVFPGGKLEATERPEDGAIRETFEEDGVLLATGPDGAPVRADTRAFIEYRRACAGDHRAFGAMVERERLRLLSDRLVYFAHWVTPEDLPLRFDTHFFAGAMPDGQHASGDGHEVIDLRWLAPGEALAAQRRGEISLRLPTQKNLALFDGAASSAEVLERVRGREIVTMRPRVLVEDGTRRVLLPGDPGWH
ncbi:MAG: NUDIX hydrolase [Candidatus Rokuibacteriota bacterium]